MNPSKIVISFGKYKGERLGDLPASYLLWLGDQHWIEEKFPDIKAYIDAERPRLEKESQIDRGGFYAE